MDTETLSKDEVLEIFATVRKRPVRGFYTGVGRRVPSDRPPVQTPAELGLVASDVADLVKGNGNGNGHPTGNGSPSLTKPAAAPGQQGADTGHGPASGPAGGSTGPAAPPPDAPRIANPWAPPVWPNDDERKRR
jgi:cell division protease FtsH